MKLPLIAAAAVLLASSLTGCVVAPYEPLAYVPPPPPRPVVVVRPAYGPYHYHRRPYWRRWH